MIKVSNMSPRLDCDLVYFETAFEWRNTLLLPSNGTRQKIAVSRRFVIVFCFFFGVCVHALACLSMRKIKIEILFFSFVHKATCINNISEGMTYEHVKNLFG